MPYMLHDTLLRRHAAAAMAMLDMSLMFLLPPLPLLLLLLFRCHTRYYAIDAFSYDAAPSYALILLYDDIAFAADDISFRRRCQCFATLIIIFIFIDAMLAAMSTRRRCRHYAIFYDIAMPLMLRHTLMLITPSSPCRVIAFSCHTLPLIFMQTCRRRLFAAITRHAYADKRADMLIADTLICYATPLFICAITRATDDVLFRRKMLPYAADIMPWCHDTIRACCHARYAIARARGRVLFLYAFYADDNIYSARCRVIYDAMPLMLRVMHRRAHNECCYAASCAICIARRVPALRAPSERC